MVDYYTLGVYAGIYLRFGFFLLFSFITLYMANKSKRHIWFVFLVMNLCVVFFDWTYAVDSISLILPVMYLLFRGKVKVKK